LAPREKSIVKLVAEGRTTRLIAEMLGLTERTVAKYREDIMRKLGLGSIAELTKYAIRRGMTTLD
jgi:DNA-binding CsgD family transcriptional regulator